MSLRELRQKRGLTQRQLADALKVSNPRKLLEAEKPKENTSAS